MVKSIITILISVLTLLNVYPHKDSPTDLINKYMQDYAKTASSTLAVSNTVAETPKVITCNPRGYDATYFEENKPCISDMTTIDIERENKALSVINSTISEGIKEKPWLPSLYSLPHLLVSDKKYQLMSVNIAPKNGYVVIDTDSGVITDYLAFNFFIENLPLKFVFLNNLTSQANVIGESVRQYTFGQEKSATLPETEVYYPKSYRYYDGPEGSQGVKIISSTTDSITLGIFDQNKPLALKPGDDTTYYEQIGIKTIDLAD